MPLWLVKCTVMHSPAATCSTSGSGALAPFITAAASAVGTKAVRTAPWNELLLGTSTALTAKLYCGAPLVHGLPGLVVAGGRPPVTAGA